LATRRLAEAKARLDDAGAHLEKMRGASLAYVLSKFCFWAFGPGGSPMSEESIPTTAALKTATRMAAAKLRDNDALTIEDGMAVMKTTLDELRRGENLIGYYAFSHDGVAVVSMIEIECTPTDPETVALASDLANRIAKHIAFCAPSSVLESDAPPGGALFGQVLMEPSLHNIPVISVLSDFVAKHNMGMAIVDIARVIFTPGPGAP
jgi:hypothetical protein